MNANKQTSWQLCINNYRIWWKIWLLPTFTSEVQLSEIVNKRNVVLGCYNAYHALMSATWIYFMSCVHLFFSFILLKWQISPMWLGMLIVLLLYRLYHDDVIKWKHFPRNWPFVREIHRSPVNFPHKGQWRGALMFSLIYAWLNDWVNNREAGDLRRQHGHYDVIVMSILVTIIQKKSNQIITRLIKQWYSLMAFKPCT